VCPQTEKSSNGHEFTGGLQTNKIKCASHINKTSKSTHCSHILFYGSYQSAGGGENLVLPSAFTYTLHTVNNLRKLWHNVETLRHVWKKHYNFSKHPAGDKIIILFNWRVVFKQYNTNTTSDMTGRYTWVRAHSVCHKARLHITVKHLTTSEFIIT